MRNNQKEHFAVARPTEYQVVTGLDPVEFATNVQSALNDGWELWEAAYYGSATQVRSGGDKDMMHCQPMIKFDDSLTQGTRPFRLSEKLTLSRSDDVTMTS